MIVAMFSSLTERRPLAYECGRPAVVSSILLSNIGEDLTAVAVVVVVVEDSNNLRDVCALYKYSN
jgi:hypothetical protein